jgi:hypothetical protein
MMVGQNALSSEARKKGGRVAEKSLFAAWLLTNRCSAKGFDTIAVES